MTFIFTAGTRKRGNPKIKLKRLAERLKAKKAKEARRKNG